VSEVFVVVVVVAAAALTKNRGDNLAREKKGAEDFHGR
jgi:hypothetical protein